MKKEYCADCVCLVEGENKEWVCDECQNPIEQVRICPEAIVKVPNYKLIVYRIGFNGNDETEVDAMCEEEAVELAKIVAAESGLKFKLDYVETCGYVRD